jgi:hypothetical protein
MSQPVESLFEVSLESLYYTSLNVVTRTAEMADVYGKLEAWSLKLWSFEIWSFEIW